HGRACPELGVGEGQWLGHQRRGGVGDGRLDERRPDVVLVVDAVAGGVGVEQRVGAAVGDVVGGDGRVEQDHVPHVDVTVGVEVAQGTLGQVGAVLGDAAS